MRPRETLTDSRHERLLQARLTCPDITRPATSPAPSPPWSAPSTDTCCWVDPAGRAGRTEAHEGLRRLPSPQPRRRHRRTRVAMEFGSGRRPCEPGGKRSSERCMAVPRSNSCGPASSLSHERQKTARVVPTGCLMENAVGADSQRPHRSANAATRSIPPIPSPG